MPHWDQKITECKMLFTVSSASRARERRLDNFKCQNLLKGSEMTGGE